MTKRLFCFLRKFANTEFINITLLFIPNAGKNNHS